MIRGLGGLGVCPYRGLLVILGMALGPGISQSWARSGASEGDRWLLAPSMSPDETFAAEMRKRYPRIRTADDLTDILISMSQKKPYSQLEFRWIQSQSAWVLEGLPAQIVGEITVESRARLIRQPLYAAIQSVIGQVNAPETQARVVQASERHLRRKGYRKARVQLRVQGESSERSGSLPGGPVSYDVIVNEGNPCVLSKIEWGFSLPPDIKFNLNRGDICDLDTINTATEDLESDLRELGYTQLKIRTEELFFDPDQDSAVLRVVGSLGQRVRYEIEDENRLFLIDDLFADEELTRVDPTIVGPDAMAAELARRYRQRGFLDVVVENPEIKQKDQDLFVYVFSVKPGRQYVINETKYEGVTVFSADQLNDTMGLKSFWQTAVPANIEDIQTGIGALKGRYQKQGYWDVKIRDPGMGQRDRETGTVRLVIQVEEGRQTRLGRLNVVGRKNIPLEDILDIIKVNQGEPLDRGLLVNWQQEIKSLYVSRGYIYAEIDFKFSPKNTRKIVTMDLDVIVREGPLVRIGQIAVRGLNQTAEKVVRRELLMATGDWYNPDDINKSRQNLASLGIFRSVQIVPQDKNAYTQKYGVIDLIVDVQETRAGAVAFGPGWSLYKGWSYGAEASYANIGGLGRQASLRASISEERDQYAIGNKTLVGRRIGAGYTEPFIFDAPIDMRTKMHQKAEWNGELWGLRFGGEVEFVHKLRKIADQAQVSTFYSQEIARTEGSSQKEDQLLATNVRVGSVGLRLSYDHRDSPTFPLKGFVVDQEFAWARYELGGDLRYFKWDFTGAQYLALSDRWVMAFGLSAQSYDQIGRKGDVVGVLPPSERLFSGGVDTVRGYEPRSLGPVVRSPVIQYDSRKGDCDVNYSYSNLFGTARTTIKLELRHKITDDIAFAAFTDNGNVFLSKPQARKFDEAYAEPVAIPTDVPPDSPCQSLRLNRKVYENFPYSHGSLVSNPRGVFDQHYFSYGTYGSWLLPVGSVNLIYGLPWKEPEDPACKASPSECIARKKRGGHWITRGVWYLNVGARF